AGDLLYGLELWSHLGGLLVVALASAAACSAFGLFVTALAPNEAAANPISTLLVLTMSAIGGAWFPVSFMPETIQSAAKLTLVYWSVEGFTDVLWAGRSLLDILPKAGVLLAMAALVMTFSVWRFQRSKFFT
ncbi:MAG TPA: ABC transporter permease, partial [Opitutus sp.]|nr:ABC transporter permease [Opitutus sp.]